MTRLTAAQKGAVAGLDAVRVLHPGATLDTLSEEKLADVVADLMHLAAAAGLDPEEMVAHGRRYFHGEVNEGDPA